MNQINSLYEIKGQYTKSDVSRILYPFATHLMGAVLKSGAASYAKLVDIIADYGLLLTPNYSVVNADLPEILLPKTLWGEVPHTLPMMIYRMHSLIEFFNERIPGTVIISDDFSTWCHHGVTLRTVGFTGMLKNAEKILNSGGVN